LTGSSFFSASPFDTAEMSVRKIHSYPFFGKVVVRESVHDIFQAKIYALDDELLQRVLSYLTFAELQNLKTTCYWFYVVIGCMTNKAFLSISERVDDEMKAVESFIGKNELVAKYMKVLNIVSSEVEMLEVTFLDHVRANTMYFSGGNILDLLDSILNTSDFINLDHQVNLLFTEINEYLDSSETLLKKVICSAAFNSEFRWFGNRVVDILDCFLNVDYDVVLSQNSLKNKNYCRLVGKYFATVDHECLPPPTFQIANCKSCEPLFELLIYIRNHIRWNNYVNYMSYNMSISNDAFLPEKVIQSPSGNRTRFIRRHSNHDDAENRPFSARIDIYCHKLLAPTKCKTIFGDEELMDLMTFGGNLVDAESLEYFSRIQKAMYECNFTMSVLHSPDPVSGNMKKTTVTLSINDENCSISSSTVYGS